MTEKIKNLMSALNITEEEAIEVAKADLRIENGEKLFELTPEQKKSQKRARKTVPMIKPYGEKSKRKLKINPNREKLMLEIYKAILPLVDTIERAKRISTDYLVSINGEYFHITVQGFKNDKALQTYIKENMQLEGDKNNG